MKYQYQNRPSDFYHDDGETLRPIKQAYDDELNAVELDGSDLPDGVYAHNPATVISHPACCWIEKPERRYELVNDMVNVVLQGGVLDVEASSKAFLKSQGITAESSIEGARRYLALTAKAELTDAEKSELESLKSASELVDRVKAKAASLETVTAAELPINWGA